MQFYIDNPELNYYEQMIFERKAFLL